MTHASIARALGRARGAQQGMGVCGAARAAHALAEAMSAYQMMNRVKGSDAKSAHFQTYYTLLWIMC